MRSQIKLRLDNVVRDIDDWMFHFERQVAPRLRKLLHAERGDLPHDIASRLEKLRAAHGGDRHPSDSEGSEHQ